MRKEPQHGAKEERTDVKGLIQPRFSFNQYTKPALDLGSHLAPTEIPLSPSLCAAVPSPLSQGQALNPVLYKNVLIHCSATSPPYAQAQDTRFSCV